MIHLQPARCLLDAIPGLTCVPDFLTTDEEATLLTAVDEAEWSTKIARRTQHYGYQYDYTARSVDPSMFLGPLPDWSADIAARLVTDGHMPSAPDQLIVNEYTPGQGIGDHVDCVPCFGPVVCSVTLGSACVMHLKEVDGAGHIELPLRRGSLLVLTDAARYDWRHGIKGRQSDVIDGERVQRGRRVSLTFRNVIVETE